MKKVFINIGIVCFSVFLALVFSELVLKLFDINGKPLVDDSINTFDDHHLGLRLVPNQDGVDAKGYNNRITPEKVDIVALGDSHTYAGHTSLGRIDISWPARLAQLSSTTVYNMGIWGYGTAQYRYLFDQAVAMNPKYIIVGMYTANDLFDAYDVVYHKSDWEQYRSEQFVDGTPTSISQTKQIKVPFRGLRDWLNNQSVLYNLLGNQTRVLREKIGISTPVLTGTTDWGTTNPDASLKFDDGNLTTLFWTSHRLAGVNLDDEKIKEGWRISQQMYAEMADIAKENDIRLIILLIPSKMTVYNTLVNQQSLSNDSFEKIVNYEKRIREGMQYTCLELDITCVDLALELSRALEQGEKIYPEDRNEHPLPGGYEVYAEALLSSVQ